MAGTEAVASGCAVAELCLCRSRGEDGRDGCTEFSSMSRRLQGGWERLLVSFVVRRSENRSLFSFPACMRRDIKGQRVGFGLRLSL